MKFRKEQIKVNLIEVKKRKKNQKEMSYHHGNKKLMIF